MIYLTDIQKAKIQRMLQDKDLVEGLKRVFWEVFTSTNIVHDVNVLAASRLSLTFLEEGFKALERLRVEPNEQSPNKNPAL